MIERKVVLQIVKVVMWVTGLYLSTRYHMHTLYFIVSGFYLMFTNLGTRQKGTLSAYSVFNEKLRTAARHNGRHVPFQGLGRVGPL